MTRHPHLPGHLLIWGILLGASHAAAENETTVSRALPLVIVNNGRAVTDDEAQAVIDGLGTPVQRGRELMGHMGIVPPASPAAAERVKALFAEAEDRFFDGRHREATAKFSRIVTLAEAHPEQLIHDADVQTCVFKSRIHLAVIAADDDPLVEAHLAAAAAFRDREPTTADFPPWVCERFQTVKRAIAQKRAAVATITVMPGCRLHTAGKSVGSYTGTAQVPASGTIAQIVCDDRTSLIQAVDGDWDQRRRAPIFLTAGALLPSEADVTLEAAALEKEEPMLADLATLLDAAGGNRLVAVVGAKTTLAVWLIDARSRLPLRVAEADASDLTAIRAAGTSVAAGPKAGESAVRAPAKRAWYRDAAAWTLVGTGVAALGAGVALYAAFGTESPQELGALAATVSGGGLMGTGFVLFFVQPEAAARRTGTARKVPMVGLSQSF